VTSEQTNSNEFEETNSELLTVGSLFAGIGGFDYGLESTGGFRTAWQVEINPFCNQILAKHWPNVKRYQDVKEINPEQLEKVDLICGGFPCQPASNAGRRKGTDDDRWLWPEFIRIVRAVRPTWVLAENVPGLFSVNSGRAFGEVVGDLAALGYSVQWDCIPAAAVGAPHIRDRVWIVAHAGRTAWGPGAAERRGDGGQGDETGERSESPVQAETRRGVVAHSKCGCDKCQEFNQTNREKSNGSPGRPSRPGGIFGPPGLFDSWDRDPATFPPETESFVGRVVDGLSGRVDRLRALGNAVVPQVVHHLGRRILANHLSHADV